jgi:uncharacterized protein
MIGHYNRSSMAVDPFPVGPASASLPNQLLTGAALVAAAGAACVAYGVVIERRWYRVARYRVPILPDSTTPLTLLHLSDLHFVAGDRRKADFVASLPRPDVLAVTGDLLGEPEAVEEVVEALRPVRGRAASYVVLGSNDYFAPQWLNYAAYFRWRRKHRSATVGRARDLVAQLEAEGWEHLRNRRETLTVDGARFEVTGLDDPHIEWHDLRAGPRRDPDAVGLALVHAPDPAPELAALGYDLILSGHTHGGQVRMPFVGALVSNCTLPNRLAMGMSRMGPAYLHVSPGLGTSKYAPFRFLCRPEATVLELVPAHPAAAAATATTPPVHLVTGQSRPARDVAQFGSAQRSGR